MKICLDPGHGGSDPGAIGPTGISEKQIVLKVCFTLRTILEQSGYDVIITRSSDRFVDLCERVEMMNFCDFFLSVHCNAFSTSSVQGIETIYSNKNLKSKDLAGMVQDSLMKDPFTDRPHKDRGLKLSPSSKYERKLYVLDRTIVPGALCELEFISNPIWERHLLNHAIPVASLLYSAVNRFAKTLMF